MTYKKVTFKNYLKAFPKVELPITLDEHSHHTFSSENKPLPPQLIHEYILSHEEGDADEFTEYIPCFQLPDKNKFHAVVYWKAMLMDYNYILNTYDLKGNFIKSYHIGGTKSDGVKIARLLCTIQEDLEIQLAAGTTLITEKEYEPTETKVFKIQILENGMANIEMEEDIWS